MNKRNIIGLIAVAVIIAIVAFNVHETEKEQQAAADRAVARAEWIKTHPKEYAEEQAAARKESERQAHLRATEAAALATPAVRKAYADKFDEKMLDMAIESRTEATGQNRTTLTIHSAAAGRVFARKLSEALPWDDLRKIGFKKVVLTDDYNFTMYWTP